jgi:predicted lipoprotein with Yx(FWY)xxD motif
VKRVLAAAATASILAAAAIAVPLASGARPAPAAHDALFYTVELSQTKLGKILSTASGYTLYAFTKDTSKKDACVEISGCTAAWPPDEVAGSPSAGPGLSSKLLKTIALSSGGKQVTYNGHPLYVYAFDSGPHQTSYVGVTQFGGTWEAVNAKGKLVK